MSGASSAARATAEELKFLSGLKRKEFDPIVRAWGSVLGHAMEAHFLTGIALAGLAVSKEAFYPPFDSSGVEHFHEGRPEQILVTGFGHWRGEGLGLVQSAA